MVDTVKNVQHTYERIKEDSPGMWQDFYEEKRPFGKMMVYKNDFCSWVSDEWTATEATAATQVLADERNGVLVLTAAATEDNGTQIQLGGSSDSETVGESWAPAAGKNMWFETRVASLDADQNDFFVGLHNEDTSIIAGRGTDYIGFYTIDESANLNCQSAATSVVSSQTALTTVVNSTYLVLGFKVSGVSKIEFYINNVMQATLSTNIPTALMRLSLANLTGAAVANTLSIDYVIMAQDR